MTGAQLQRHLSDQHLAMTRLQSHAHAQQVKANLVVTSLRAKVRRKEQELRTVRTQHEQAVSAILARLLYLEGGGF